MNPVAFTTSALPTVNGALRPIFEHAIRVAFGALTNIAAKHGPPRDEAASWIIQEASNTACEYTTTTGEDQQAVGCRVWCMFRLIGTMMENPWLNGYVMYAPDGGFDLTEHIVEAAASCRLEPDFQGLPRFEIKHLRDILDRLNRPN